MTNDEADAEHPPFALGRFAGADGAFSAVMAHDTVLPLSACELGLSDEIDPADALSDWAAVGEPLTALAARIGAGEPLPGAVSLSSTRRLAPVRPRQVFAAGLNYRTHVIDLMVDQGVGSRAEATAMMDTRARSGVPFVWVGLPSSVCGPDDDVVLRPGSERSDWELELAAVIGRPAHGLSREQALACVAGWTVANDLTARELVPRDDLGPVGADWLRAKCAPTYKPVGPYVVPSAFVSDPQDLRIQLRLNGELMQDESTADMIFDAATLVAFVSQQAQLLPGDIVLTGSPAGNGSHYDRWLRPGDVMDGSITGLGTQRNRVVSA